MNTDGCKVCGRTWKALDATAKSEPCPWCALAETQAKLDTAKARVRELEHSLELMDHAHKLTAERLRELESYVRDQACECVDEYGHDRPSPCDRCTTLGEDHRRAAAAAKGASDGA